jgi:hypothetical protein
VIVRAADYISLRAWFKFRRSSVDAAKQVEAKIAGKEIVAPPPAQEHVAVINLMDALKASVQQAHAAGKPAEGKRPATRGILLPFRSRWKTSHKDRARRSCFAAPLHFSGRLRWCLQKE